MSLITVWILVMVPGASIYLPMQLVEKPPLYISKNTRRYTISVLNICSPYFYIGNQPPLPRLFRTPSFTWIVILTNEYYVEFLSWIDPCMKDLPLITDNWQDRSPCNLIDWFITNNIISLFTTQRKVWRYQSNQK